MEVFEEPLPAEQLESITVVLAELVKRCEERRAERESKREGFGYSGCSLMGANLSFSLLYDFLVCVTLFLLFGA